MKKTSVRSIFILFGVIFSLVLLNRFLFKGSIGDLALRAVRAPASYLYQRAGVIRTFWEHLGTVRQVTRENIRLTEENQKFISSLAALKDVEGENAFLRGALELSAKLPKHPIEGNIFTLGLEPAGYGALLNKGRTDGVLPDAVIVSGQGVLIGQVKEVGGHVSRVMLVIDPAFQVTAKVLDSDTSGIAKGDLDRGLLLDLIVHTDPIKEGDRIVTGGNDLIPAGLFIGTVASVDANEAKVFKGVRIKPAFDNGGTGRVLIFNNN